MRLLATALLAMLLGFGSQMAHACDPQSPRCKSVNELLDALGYKDSLYAMQTECRNKVVNMSPDNLAKHKPAMLMGILKDGDSWSQVQQAYDNYVGEACGGDELVMLILGAYQTAWDTRLSDQQLQSTLALAKTGGKQAVSEEAKAVSERVNGALGPVLAKMEKAAVNNYSASIKGIITGEALGVISRQSCTAPAGAFENKP